MTSSTTEQWNAMSKLVHSFYQKPDAEPFREEVNWKMLGLHDYPTIIKHPMDLGTVKKKLAANAYATVFDCHGDVRLVWNNCMTYNQDGSDFFILAQTLSKKWEERFQKLVQDFGLGVGGNSKSTNVVSLEDKRAFAKLLYKLTKEDLGKIVVDLDNKSPQALVKNVTEDEMELNVDLITPAVFLEMLAFATECVKTYNAPSTKKGTTTTASAASATSMTGTNTNTTTKPAAKKQKLG